MSQENDIARRVVDAAYHIHVGLGPGLLESVYEAVLAHELRAQKLDVRRQVPVPVVYKDLRFDEGFGADLIVQDRVIVELKSIEQMGAVHAKQVLTYLRLADKRLGLLINFGESLFRDGVKRVVNDLQDR